MERYSNKGLVVVGINCEDKAEREARFARSKGLSYPILLEAKPIFEAYGTRGMPTNLLIDREGIVRDRRVANWGEFEKRIESLVEEKGDSTPGRSPR